MYFYIGLILFCLLTEHNKRIIVGIAVMEKRTPKKRKREMIIGAKRKEEIIKLKRYGMYETYVSHDMPIEYLYVSKNGIGDWVIWEMVKVFTGKIVGKQIVAAYRTRKQAISVASELGIKRHLAVR